MGSSSAPEPSDEDLEALDLHARGFSMIQIAQQQGTNRKTAYRRVDRALRTAPAFRVHEYRLARVLQYDTLRGEVLAERSRVLARIRDEQLKPGEHASLAKAADDQVRTLLAIDAREASLIGADAPQQVEANVQVDTTTRVATILRDQLELDPGVVLAAAAAAEPVPEGEVAEGRDETD